jgi:ribonuclease Z
VTSPVRGLTGFSRGMFSNWCSYEPFGLVVDAGEGLQLALGQKIWAPQIVALTHGHSDHVLGLPGFIASRRYAKGAQEKPLTVVFPDGSSGALAVRDLVERFWPNESFPVTWTPVRAGAQVRLGKTRVLEAFPNSHGVADPTLGYLVFETRRRLKARFSGLAEAEIRALVQAEGRERVVEEYRHVCFAHTGDSMPIDAGIVAKADLLVHDATFLEEADRKWNIHASTREALEVGRAAGVACLVLHHLSIRYERGAALPILREQVAASGFAGECWLLDEGRLINLRQADGSPRRAGTQDGFGSGRTDAGGGG